MLVTITQEHIDRGQRGKPSCCPIALALHDAGLPKAAVSIWTYWPVSGDSKEVDMPVEAAELAFSFDIGHRVKPTTIEFPDL